MAKQFIQKAVSQMKKKGTVGAFGKATPKKVAAGLKAGGVQAKRAAFAKAMANIAKNNKKK